MSNRNYRVGNDLQLALGLEWEAVLHDDRSGRLQVAERTAAVTPASARGPRQVRSTKAAPQPALRRAESRGQSIAPLVSPPTSIELNPCTEVSIITPGPPGRSSAARESGVIEQAALANREGALTRADYIAQIIDAAPALSPSQRHQLLGLFQPPGPTQSAIIGCGASADHQPRARHSSS
jgi:hypothetical protein